MNTDVSQLQKLPDSPGQHPIRKALIWTVAILGGLVALAILVVIITVIIPLANSIKSHSNQLDQLEKATVSLFSDTEFVATPYDCHDVELRNQCFFSLDTSSSNIEKHLLQNGFSRDASSGSRPGYSNGNLYIKNTDSKGGYTSYYIAK